MKSMPLSPATAACHVDGASLPTGVTAPRPVTTTLRSIRLELSLVPDAWPECALPPDGGRARLGAARARRLAVRAEMGRLPRHPRERRRRARALEPKRAATPALLPRASRSGRPPSADVGARRPDRDQ